MFSKLIDNIINLLVRICSKLLVLFIPIIIAVDCGSLPEVKFTNNSGNCKNSTLYGSICEYNCQQGYNFGKDKYNWIITCLGNASWSFVPIACLGKLMVCVLFNDKLYYVIKLNFHVDKRISTNIVLK